MAKAPSFLEFYKILTANSQAASQQRSAGLPVNIVRSNYGTYASENGGGLGRTGQASQSSKSSDPNSKLGILARTLPLVGSYLAQAMDNPEDTGSPGARAIDLLSRGLYASASYSDAQNTRMAGESQSERLKTDLGDILDPDALKAAWAGLQGKSKLTYKDVLENAGTESDGFLDGARNFGLDVLLDPTTYVGAGLVRGGLKGVGLLKESDEAAEIIGRPAHYGTPKTASGPKVAGKVLEGTVVGGGQADALSQLVGSPERLQINPGPTRESPVGEGPFVQGRGETQSLDEFLKFLDSREGRASNGMPGDVFQTPKAPEQGLFPPKVTLPDEPRHFNVGAEGVATEAKMLPGPTPDVLAGRARRTQLDDMARGLLQFEYDPKVDAIPTSGWWKETVKQVPIEDPASKPRFTPEELQTLRTRFNKEELKILGVSDETALRHMEELEKVNNRYRYLTEQGDKDLQGVQNPLARIIMSKVDEPVYPAYEPKQMPISDGKGGRKTHTVWTPKPEDVRDGNYTYMGEIRERLQKYPKGSSQWVAAQEQLVNHIRAVRDYAKSNAPGFKGTSKNPELGYQNFIKELYGVNPKHMEEALSGGKSKSVLPVAGPFQDPPAPTYKEIREFSKLGWQEKQVFLHQLAQEYGVKPEHITYLAQASNHASFLTRLERIQYSVKPVRDIDDIADAIESGRLQQPDLDAGNLDKILEFFKVKTLPQLVKAIRKESANLSKAQKAMLGRYVADAEGNISTKAKFVKEKPLTKIRETGPAGEEYKPYSGKAKAPVTPKAARLTKAVTEAKTKAREVPVASEIVERVKTGDKTDLVEPNPSLTTSQNGMFGRAVNSAVIKNVIDAKDKTVYPYRTNTGVARTKKTPGKGVGRRQDTWNAYAQYDAFRSVIGDFSRQFRLADSKDQFADAGLRAKDKSGLRADVAYQQVMPVLDHLGKYMRGHGVFPTIGVKNSDTPVGMFDVFDSIDPAWIKEFIFKVTPRTVGDKKIYESVVSPTTLMGAIDVGVAAVRHGAIDPTSADELAELMFAHLREAKKGVPNGVKNLINTGDQNAVEEFMAPLIEALPDIVRKAEKYGAERELYHQNQISKGTQAALEAIAREVIAPDSSISKMMKIANEMETKIIPRATRATKLDADDAWAVNTEVNSVADQMGAIPEVRAEGARAAKRAGTTTKTANDEVGVSAMRETADDLDNYYDFADEADRLEAARTQRFINAVFPHWGNERIRPMFLDHKSALQTTARSYQSALADIQRTHGKEAILTAWSSIRTGAPIIDAPVKAAAADLHKAVGVMFSPDSAYSVYARNGLTPEELNRHFAHYGIPDHLAFKSADEMHEAWKQWDVKDPLDILAKVNAATSAALSKKLLGDQLGATFGSKTRKPGYVKVTGGPKNELQRYLPEGYYFPSEIAKEMKILDDFMVNSMKPANSGNFLRTYDTLLHGYKSGLTIYRPGHHVRNMVGDLWLSHMAGVNNPTVYSRAFKVMKGNRGMYRDLDELAAFYKGDKLSDTAGAMPILKARIGGKQVELTDQTIYRMAYERGLLPDYRTLDDIQIGSEGDTLIGAKDLGPVGNRIRAPFKGNVRNVAANVSETRDHFVRISHLIDTIEKGNFKTLDEAFDKGVHTVRKWHPDGSDLSHMEQSKARRLILFYSWIRKAIPLVAEAMVMSPGKVMMYPKAVYNMAEANGIDLESLGNPFPTDQMFPEWITDGLTGPVTENEDGEYFGINPGVPMIDVLSDYGGSNLSGTMLGSLTPAIKLPGETLFGSLGKEGAVAVDARTGIPHFDKSDYVDKQIPNSSLFTGMTGRSLTQPWEAKGGDRNADNLEEQDSLLGEDAPRTLANFLSGLGIMPMSKDSYIKQAKREETARRQEERAR